MNKFLLFKIISFILILNGCANSEKSSTSFKDFNLSSLTKNIGISNIEDEETTILPTKCIKEGTNILLSDIFTSINLIPLETSKDALIGDVYKLLFCDSTLIIVDRYKTKTVKHFTNQGKFIGLIGSIGKGPGQYTEPTDCVIFNNMILIYDQFQHKIIFYDKNSHLLKEKKVPFTFSSFHVFANNSFLFQMFDSDNFHINEIIGYSLIWCDSLFNIKHKGIYKEKDKYNNYTNRGLENRLDKIYFHPPFTDSVYQIKDNGKIKLEFLLDTHKQIPEELLLRQNQNKLFDMLSKTPNNYMLFTNNAYVSNQYVFYEISLNRFVNRVFYNKKTKECYAGDRIGNDLNPLISFNKFLYSDSCFLIGYNQAYSIIDNMKFIKETGSVDMNKIMDKKSLDIITNLNNYSNLVLIYYQYAERNN